MSRTDSRNFLFAIHCLFDEQHMSCMSSLKRHLSICTQKPRVSLICGHCGQTYTSMAEVSNHLNVKDRHKEMSKITGYHPDTFQPAQFLRQQADPMMPQYDAPLSPSTFTGMTSNSAPTHLTISSGDQTLTPDFHLPDWQNTLSAQALEDIGAWLDQQPQFMDQESSHAPTPSMLTLDVDSNVGPSASQAPTAPSAVSRECTIDNRDQEIKALRQKLRHTAMYTLWSMEIHRQYVRLHGDTTQVLPADDAYRPLLQTTGLWPQTGAHGIRDQTPASLMADLIPLFQSMAMNDD